VTALTIVENLDVLEDRRLRRRSRGEVRVVDQLLLERGEEALHRRVVPAIRSAAHAVGDAVLDKQALVVLAGVLAAAVGMCQQPLAGQAALHGHRQRIHNQAALQVFGHRPTHDASRVQILDGCQVQPALTGRDAGDVRHPGFVGLGGVELAVQEVVCHGHVVVRVRGRAAELPRRFRGNTGLLHPFGDGVAAAVVATGHQLSMDARAAIAGFELGMDGTDLHEKGVPPLLLRATRSLPPGVVASGGNPHVFRRASTRAIALYVGR